MTRLLTFAVLAFTVAIAIPACPQTSEPEATGVLQGKITDNYGIVISTAFVYVHGDNKVNEQVPINDNGEFTVQLPPGIYSVFVSSTGFAPFAKEIKIPRTKPAPVVLKIKLHVDLDINLEG
ncbi:MAG: carboxypeptidase-like regulatory domain-containing protein [Terracidiphilus sp.]|jgi:hypothetical protein